MKYYLRPPKYRIPLSKLQKIGSGIKYVDNWYDFASVHRNLLLSVEFKSRSPILAN